ncbi:MAG: hypothetical protein GY926_09150 [bacterium]|nr:hypothetical protein [bacterium]
MRGRDQSVLNEVLPPEDRVIEAVVARYQRVAPAITRFARAIAGKEDLVVRLGSQASGSEDEIVLDPGVFQAAYARSAPVTPAEVALTSALHEVVHLLASDFEEMRPIPRAWLAHREDRETTEEPEEIEIAIPAQPPLMFEDDDPDSLDVDMVAERAPLAPEDQPVALLDAISSVGGPAAEALFFSLEDARQERVLLDGFGGVRSVLSDLYLASMPRGMEEARPLGQYALACFMMVGGYIGKDRLQRILPPHVGAALDDAQPFVDDVADASDPWTVGGLALQLLEVARIHGLAHQVQQSDSRTVKTAKNEDDSSAISDSVDAVRIVTPPLRDADSYDETKAAAQAVSAQHGKAGEADQAGDPATEQLVRVSQSPSIYLPTGQSGKLVVGNFPSQFRDFATEGRELLVHAARQWGVVQRRVAGELYPLFLANQRRGLRSGFDAGDLSPYAALLLGAGLYERMFERRDLPSRRSYAVSLLVDGSASMLQPLQSAGVRKTPWALAAASLGAWSLALLCDELQIDFEVAVFNRSFPASHDDSERSFTERRHRATGGLKRSHSGSADRLTRTVNHYLVKPFDDRWRRHEDVLAGLFYMAAAPREANQKARRNPDIAPPVSMFDKAANVDEFNVTYAAQRLAARYVSTRILVVLADGMTRGSVQALAASVEQAEKTGTTVLGIGIGDDTVNAAYSRHQVVERPEELTRAMIDGVRSTLLQTIAAAGGETWWVQSSSEHLAQQRRGANA